MELKCLTDFILSHACVIWQKKLFRRKIKPKNTPLWNAFGVQTDTISTRIYSSRQLLDFFYPSLEIDGSCFSKKQTLFNISIRFKSNSSLLSLKLTVLCNIYQRFWTGTMCVAEETKIESWNIYHVSMTPDPLTWKRHFTIRQKQTWSRCEIWFFILVCNWFFISFFFVERHGFSMVLKSQFACYPFAMVFKQLDLGIEAIENFVGNWNKVRCHFPKILLKIQQKLGLNMFKNAARLWCIALY